MHIVKKPDLKLNDFFYFYTSLYNSDFNLNDFELNVFFLGPKCVQLEALLHLILKCSIKVSSLKKELVNPFIDAKFGNLNFQFKYLAN